MLTATRQADGHKLAAWEADKNERPFICHCCGTIVTLRKGGIRAAHFAHQPPVTCEYGTGESEEHRLCKIAIYEGLCREAGVTKCEIERNLGTVRPDVSAYINNVPVAIEVQLSSLSLAKIEYRTMEYARRGIYVLWLPLYTEALRRELYRPRPWERWLHAAYFGRVYYWLEGLRIVPVHFRDYYASVRGRTRDYRKLSPGKVPLEGETAILTKDFRPVPRDAWANEHISIPRSKLLMDKQPAWY
ncbi:MAG TPA: competence protein CoiA family protein [Pyrinomonadaceae bacterium]|jgi:competence protein CoiA|nr:competence protein CoiA family protein [Pyrinomonadaceae bacterium]